MTEIPALRPYQSDVIRRVYDEVKSGRRRILLVSPTGSGKTVIAAAIIRDAVERGMHVLFIHHRVEIGEQTSRKLYAAGVDHGIIQAGFAPRPGERVQVASVQTLHARAVRGRAMDMPQADVVVVDECHHVRASTYQEILDAFPGAIVVGLTATPCRGDGRGLGNVFDVLVECAPVADLIAAGFLVPCRIYAPSQPDLSGVAVRHGDYVESQLAERMDKVGLVGDIVEHWLKLAERRRTIVFATGVQHSVHVRDEFRRANVLAEHIDGSTPREERERILKAFASGMVEVVSNAMVFTEGFDCPDIGCIVMARPTKSLGLYRQMVGRGLRTAPGKTDCLILDHSGAVFAHGFPDDNIEWVLETDRRAENKTHARRGTSPHMPALTTCPECSAIRLEGNPCSACGWRPQPRAASVDIAPGELGQVDRTQMRAQTSAHSLDEKQRFFAQLLHICRSRGYKEGWAKYKFKEKFGDWPRFHSVEPINPDPATLAWVRSRMIAWARAQSAARVARW